MIVHVCVACGFEARGRTEIMAERRFDLHDCPVPIPPMKRADELANGDRFRVLDDRARPFGPVLTVRSVPTIGRGARHLAELSGRRRPAEVTFRVRGIGRSERWTKLSCLQVVAMEVQPVAITK